jgi:hypothetical protein
MLSAISTIKSMDFSEECRAYQLSQRRPSATTVAKAKASHQSFSAIATIRGIFAADFLQMQRRLIIGSAIGCFRGT